MSLVNQEEALHSFAMGKNFRRNKKWYHNRGNSNQHDGGNLSEVELILVEKFLSDYRSLAYDIYNRRNGNHRLDTKQLNIREHTFPSLTEALCSRPYIDLPDTLSSKDRRKIHSLCSHADLYHTGVGHNNKRRIAVSIYADGFRFIHHEDLESPLWSFKVTHRFPYKMCTPWCYLHKNTTAERLAEIEEEKNLIHKFVRYPETSLIMTSYEALNLAELEHLDLSNAVTSVEETPYELVDTVAKLKVCVEELLYGDRATSLNEIAFDLEMDNQSNVVRTCLIQITANTVQKDYIIDPLAAGVWDAIGIHLGPLFSDRSILKIGHGIGGMDTSSLHRDFGIIVVNAFDTCEASAIIRHSKEGMNLPSLCKHYALPAWEHYRVLKNRFQTTNWCKRPLPKEALEYGRYDIRFLITLHKLLMRDLLKMDMITNVLSCFDNISDCDSTSNTENNGEEHREQKRSNVSDSSVESFCHPNEKHDVMMPTKTSILVSDLSGFEKLMKAISISQKRCLKLWVGKVCKEGETESILRNQSFIFMIKQSSNSEKQCGKYKWTDKNTKLYRELSDWRATVAERENVDVNDVCSLDMLGKIRHFETICLQIELLPSHSQKIPQSSSHINYLRIDQNSAVSTTGCLH